MTYSASPLDSDNCVKIGNGCDTYLAKGVLGQLVRMLVTFIQPLTFLQRRLSKQGNIKAGLLDSSLPWPIIKQIWNLLSMPTQVLSQNFDLTFGDI